MARVRCNQIPRFEIVYADVPYGGTHACGDHVVALGGTSEGATVHPLSLDGAWCCFVAEEEPADAR